MGQISLSFGPVDFTGPLITDRHFGMNVVFTKDYLDPGAFFDRFLQQMDVNLLRYPGGVIELNEPGGYLAERMHDVTRPSGISDGLTRIVTAPRLYEYAEETESGIIYTLPTERYLSDTRDADGDRIPNPFGLYRIIDRVDHIIRGEYGDASSIEMFVIGNEFWFQNDRMTAREYGKIADAVTRGLIKVYDDYRNELDDPDSWVAPKIAVQAGLGWRIEDNLDLIDQISMEARAAISVIDQHFYPARYASIANYHGPFDRMDDFANAEGFGELEYLISEWNTFAKGDGERGLLQASNMPEIMRMMLSRGVDYATVWGTTYLNLPSRLAWLRPDPDAPGGFSYTLTPSGEVYRWMSEGIRGMQVLNVDTPRNPLRDDLRNNDPDRDQAVMQAFGNDDKVMIFFSSRSNTVQEVTLDLTGLIPSYHHMWGQKLGVIDDPLTPADEGDPFFLNARPYITSYESAVLVNTSGALEFTLQPYEVMKLEFSIGQVGVLMRGHDQVVDPAANYNDTLIGSQYDDIIFGNAGDDLLRGLDGNDYLDGGEGNDTLNGGRGDDLLISGPGNNFLYGGAGDDTLVGGTGVNLLQGGLVGNTTDVDHYIVDVLGDNSIQGYRPEDGHTLSFMGHYQTLDEVMALVRAEGNHLIIDHPEGGRTTLLNAVSRLDHLPGSLSDFMQDSPVADIVAQLTLVPPDGSIPPDPDPDEFEDPFDRFGFLEFQNILTTTSFQDMAVQLSGYDDDQLVDFMKLINPTILAYTAPPQTLGILSQLLPDEAIDDFVDRLVPGTLAERIVNNFEPELDEPPAFVFLDVRFVILSLEDFSVERGVAFLDMFGPNAMDGFLNQLDALDVDPEDYEFYRIWAGIEDSEDDDDPPLVGNPPPDNPPLQQPPPPPPDEDDDEEDPPPPATGGGGGCFVATAAYGDYDHPDVMVLRVWRDLVLANTPAGRAFIRAYYRYGPYLGDFVRPRPRLRRFSRAVLGVFVRLLMRRG